MIARSVAALGGLARRAEAGQSALALVIVVCLVLSLMVGVLSPRSSASYRWPTRPF